MGAYDLISKNALEGFLLEDGPFRANGPRQPIHTLVGQDAKTVWVKQWSAALACTVASALAMSLLDKRLVSGSDSKVMKELRFFRAHCVFLTVAEFFWERKDDKLTSR